MPGPAGTHDEEPLIGEPRRPHRSAGAVDACRQPAGDPSALSTCPPIDDLEREAERAALDHVVSTLAGQADEAAPSEEPNAAAVGNAAADVVEPADVHASPWGR